MSELNYPIRVLQIVPNMQSGGLENFIMNVYRNIDRSKVQFDFLVHYKKEFFFDKEIESLGGKIYRLSFREDNNIVKYIRDLNNFFYNHKEYKIVHGHMSSLGFIYLGLAKKYGIEHRIAHSHTSSTEKTVKGIIKSILLKLYSIYATDRFACSEVAGRYMFGNKKFLVIKNAIDIDKFTFNENVREEIRKELNIENKYVVGHIGRFCKAKNYTFLLDIFSYIHKKNPNSILILVGSGELEKEIKKKIDKLMLTNFVLMLGVRKDINRIYQAMDAFIFPSLFEGLGIVTIEAQAAGLKVFASNTIPDEACISSNFNFITLNYSAEKWAEIILNKSSNYKRKDVSEDIYKSGYSIKKISEKLCEHYFSMIN